MDERQAEMDGLLRRSMDGPRPSLSANFERRLMSRVQVGSGPLDRYRQILFGGYGFSSVVVSAVLMREQGMTWEVICLMLMLPAAGAAAVIPWAKKRSGAGSLN